MVLVSTLVIASTLEVTGRKELVVAFSVEVGVGDVLVASDEALDPVLGVLDPVFACLLVQCFFPMMLSRPRRLAYLLTMKSPLLEEMKE